MNTTAISLWLTHTLGWACLAALILSLAYWCLDRLVRILGLMGWLFCTFQQVRKDHGWVDKNCPWWWHWAAGNLNLKRKSRATPGD